MTMKMRKIVNDVVCDNDYKMMNDDSDDAGNVNDGNGEWWWW